MKRRDILKGTLAAGAALAAPGHAQVPGHVGRPGPVPAMPNPLGKRDRRLFAIAHEQLQKHTAPLWERDMVGVLDFGLRSSEPRYHFCNFETGTVDSYRVAHGQGSDPEHDGWLNWFSNVPESWCTSKGAYMTFGWYTGRYGTSIRLEGLDPTNSNALDRAIVMHRADYCEPEHLARWGRLGRSNGCFAMSDADFKLALLRMAGGRLIYAEKLGIGADGETVSETPKDLRLLLPEGQPQPAPNPGVY
ncbi:murein L,D-transpeptidase catalytic domain-containing protein [Tsuneonella amylolytica]|uniref:murein L,D-transpeptidase catalytic domain-containing protein n=1 Tax=Tsuneonella amylolytica TaxID=2338327 RepID=UPI000EA8ECCE|nr:murein L,D-transpeptidase catalytic domain family protein [Tsuneonella amylolytica]